MKCPTIHSDSLPEDIGAPDNGDLWQAVHHVHEHGVHIVEPDAIACPDCQRVATLRRDQGLQEPSPQDIVAF